MDAEIGAHRRPDLVAVRHHDPSQGTEMALAYRRIRVRVGQEGRALRGMLPMQFGDCRAVVDVISAGWREDGSHWGLLKGRRTPAMSSGHAKQAYGCALSRSIVSKAILRSRVRVRASSLRIGRAAPPARPSHYRTGTRTGCGYQPGGVSKPRASSRFRMSRLGGPAVPAHRGGRYRHEDGRSPCAWVVQVSGGPSESLLAERNNTYAAVPIARSSKIVRRSIRSTMPVVPSRTRRPTPLRRLAPSSQDQGVVKTRCGADRAYRAR